MPNSPSPRAEKLTSERLVLEPLRIDHATEMVAVLDDPELYRFIGGEPPEEADLVARYTRQVAGEGWLNWILRVRETGEPVGTVQVTLGDGTAELAWVMSPRFQGEGYASEGSAAVLDWLRERGFGVFIAHIHPDHTASQGLAARLGFEPTETVKNGEVRWELTDRCHN
jgi:RimJ/RimL family protein N-acetyltransferase